MPDEDQAALAEVFPELGDLRAPGARTDTGATSGGNPDTPTWPRTALSYKDWVWPVAFRVVQVVRSCASALATVGVQTSTCGRPADQVSVGVRDELQGAVQGDCERHHEECFWSRGGKAAVFR
ncbi:MAG TPA: hypothetical protein VKE74_05040 [Gemmataceae bacterium]|nr:hypothetical protein [Gemmataceae bacterium]